MSDTDQLEPPAASGREADREEGEEEAREHMDFADTPTPPDAPTDQPPSPRVLKETASETQQETGHGEPEEEREDRARELIAEVTGRDDQGEEKVEGSTEEVAAQDKAVVVSVLVPSDMEENGRELGAADSEGRKEEKPPGEEREEEPPKPKTPREEEKEAPHPGPCLTSVSHVYNPGWSKLSKEEIVDKIKGVIYGQAIGDAFGLATEFMDRKMAQKVYGKEGPTSYQEIAQDFHRMRWQAGDWTDDTDQMLLILHGMVENNGVVGRLDFAKRIQHWMRHGFEDLGDYGGMGIGMTVHRTLSHYSFLKDPHGAAKEVWENSGKYLAANGAIMRTSVLGILNFNDLSQVIKNSMEISQCTHADPRCTASCIAVTVAIALMLQGIYDPMKENELASMIDACLLQACRVLILPEQAKEIREHVLAPSLDKLKLDDQKTIGYTFKALGAGFYGLRTVKDFRVTIKDVIMQAGDADSNGAVCGALMGCKLGFRALPEDLLSFPHRQWLDDWVERFLKTIGLQDSL